MVKIIILICRLASSDACTEDSAKAAVFADHPDDGVRCQDLAPMLLNELHFNQQAGGKIVVACVKDGRVFP